LLNKYPQGPIIIFVNLIAEVDSLHDTLSRTGKRCTLIHGKKSQEQRERGLNALRDGSADILVCTSVVARGIDIENVAHVINFNSPSNITEYIHRIGRTGRAGKKGMATTFIHLEKDEHLLYDLKKHLGENN
jgi:superfamily II DNA/RNA helicase